MINKQIQKHLNIADKLVEKEVERLARYVLASNPKKVSKFMMAGGSWFFIDPKGDIIHKSEGNNAKMLHRLKGYTTLKRFISKWDTYMNITGIPMTFTATGKKITDW